METELTGYSSPNETNIPLLKNIAMVAAAEDFLSSMQDNTPGLKSVVHNSVYGRAFDKRIAEKEKLEMSKLSASLVKDLSAVSVWI